MIRQNCRTKYMSLNYYRRKFIINTFSYSPFPFIPLIINFNNQPCTSAINTKNNVVNISVQALVTLFTQRKALPSIMMYLVDLASNQNRPTMHCARHRYTTNHPKIQLHTQKNICMYKGLKQVDSEL